MLLDLDGTIYHEDHALPGAIELIRQLQSRRQTFACLTNSTMSENFIVQRLSRMGLSMPADKVYTAAGATCDYVRNQFCADGRRGRVFNLATDAPHELLGTAVDWVDAMDEPCDAIIVGAPSNAFATPDRQRIALSLARDGALIVGMCADRVYPSPRGIEFGAGAMTTMLAYASNQTPVFCGKPERVFFAELCRRLAVDPQRCVIVGDNLESDIGGAKRLGMQTVLTLTGVARRRDLDGLKSESMPDAVIDDLRSLLT